MFKKLREWEVKRQEAVRIKSILDNVNIRIRTVEEEIISLCCQFGEFIKFVPIEKMTEKRCISALSILRNTNVSRSMGDVDKLDEKTCKWFLSLILWSKSQKQEYPEQKIKILVRDLMSRNNEKRRRELEKEIIPMWEGKTPINPEKIKEFENLTKLLKGTCTSIN